MSEQVGDLFYPVVQISPANAQNARVIFFSSLYINEMFSQIDARVAFFRVMDLSGNLVKIADAQATMVDDQSVSSGSSYSSGAILRDMGKTVTFVNAAGQATHRYRAVRLVANSQAEGARVADIDADTEYVLVWAASGSGVNVVRLG